jgi:hypothetical protein
METGRQNGRRFFANRFTRRWSISSLRLKAVHFAHLAIQPKQIKSENRNSATGMTTPYHKTGSRKKSPKYSRSKYEKLLRLHGTHSLLNQATGDILPQLWPFRRACPPQGCKNFLLPDRPATRPTRLYRARCDTSRQTRTLTWPRTRSPEPRNR